MSIIAELGMIRVVMNKWGVWQAPAILAEVGPANIKIVTKNRDSDGKLAAHGNIHTLVRRKDGAIMKYGAPPASGVRGNVYRPANDIAASITAIGPVSRR